MREQEGMAQRSHATGTCSDTSSTAATVTGNSPTTPPEALATLRVRVRAAGATARIGLASLGTRGGTRGSRSRMWTSGNVCTRHVSAWAPRFSG